jgi:hypothetical protein
MSSFFPIFNETFTTGIVEMSSKGQCLLEYIFKMQLLTDLQQVL